MLKIKVTDAPFSAAGDGKTNDRGAIQSAIDYIYKNGGGTVVLTADRTFMSSSIVIRSGVELHFEDGAVLLQTPDTADYYKPVADGYEPYVPVIGHNFSETIKWSHTWYHNYPFIFAPEGSHGFKITGNGTVRMSEAEGADKVVRLCPIGFFRARDFVISDIRITNYHGYAMMPFTSENGLFSNIKIDTWSYGNGDGICMMNCRNVRVTGCKMFTGDDSVYIFSSYRDPRRGEWWNSDEPQASENIEIDHNDLESNHCKAFGMILWGIDCPDLEKVEVRNVYVHDNHFVTLGNWNWNPYTSKTDPHPVTGLRFENNVIDAVESNFFETQVSDMTGFNSMKQMRNGDFKDGRVFWLYEADGENKISFVRGEENYCRITLSGTGRAALWQGLFMKAKELNAFFVTAEADTDFIMKITDAASGKTVAEKRVCAGEKTRTELDFRVPSDGNYRIGLENAPDSAGEIKLFEAEFVGVPEALKGYNRITKDGGKILYYFD